MNEKNIFVLTEKLAVETEKAQQGNKEGLNGFQKVWDILAKKPFYDVKVNAKNLDEFFDNYLKNGRHNSFYPFLQNQFDVYGSTFIPAHLSMTGEIVSYYKD